MAGPEEKAQREECKAGADGNCASLWRAGVFPGECGRRTRDLRTGGARYPAPVHAGVLPVEWGKGRDVSKRACGRNPTQGKRKVGSADKEWVLRAYGEQRGFREVDMAVAGLWKPPPPCFFVPPL